MPAGGADQNIRLGATFAAGLARETVETSPGTTSAPDFVDGEVPGSLGAERARGGNLCLYCHCFTTFRFEVLSFAGGRLLRPTTDTLGFHPKPLVRLASGRQNRDVPVAAFGLAEVREIHHVFDFTCQLVVFDDAGGAVPEVGDAGPSLFVEETGGFREFPDGLPEESPTNAMVVAEEVALGQKPVDAGGVPVDLERILSESPAGLDIHPLRFLMPVEPAIGPAENQQRRCQFATVDPLLFEEILHQFLCLVHPRRHIEPMLGRDGCTD